MHLIHFLYAVAVLYSVHIFCLSESHKKSIIIEKLLNIDREIQEIIDILPKPKLRDCTEINDSGVNVSGIYEIQTLDMKNKPSRFHVYCDMETDGGGWTVFQRRGNFGHGTYYFYRNWVNYSEGFGNLNQDFWLGNDKLHILTSQGNYSLRIDLKRGDGNSQFAEYTEFNVSNEKSYYTLHVRGYKGDKYDKFTYHNKMKFSTYDRDNDQSRSNCAKEFKGAWWYKDCHESNLNGLFFNGEHKERGKGVEWGDNYYSWPNVEMKIRRNEI